MLLPDAHNLQSIKDGKFFGLSNKHLLCVWPRFTSVAVLKLPDKKNIM